MNPTSIAEAMAYLLKHVDEADGMGRRGRDMLVKQFTWAREGAKLVEMYAGLR